MGAGPVGRFAFDDVVHRLYRAPFAIDLDFVALRAMSPLVILEKSAVIGIAAIDCPAGLPPRIVLMSLIVIVLGLRSSRKNDKKQEGRNRMKPRHAAAFLLRPDWQ